MFVFAPGFMLMVCSASVETSEASTGMLTQQHRLALSRRDVELDSRSQAKPFCREIYFGPFCYAQESPLKQEAESTEIENLIAKLGSSNINTREMASRRLKVAQGAIRLLHKSLADSKVDLEHRRRIESLIKERQSEVFRRRFRNLVKEKELVPLDLLVDMLLENRQHVREQEWEATTTVLKSIISKVNKNIKPSPLSDFNIRDCHSIIGTKLLIEEPRRFRLIADQVEMGHPEARSIAVLSTTVDSGFTHFHNALLMRGGSLKTGDPAIKMGSVTGCFVFTGGDFVCSSALDTIVIAGGEIRIADQQDVVLIPCARRSAIRWFTTERIGLVLAENNGLGVVERVIPGSAAADSGFVRGDRVRLFSEGKNAIQDLEARIARTYARQSEIELTVLRSGRWKSLVLSFME